MNDRKQVFKGGCECGAITLTLDLAQEDSVPRACECVFCAPMGNAFIGGGNSRLTVRQKHPKLVYAHTFATATADFMHCGLCNSLVYVVSNIDGKDFALVARDALENAELPAAEVVSFQGETLEQRLSRRMTTWITALEVIDAE